MRHGRAKAARKTLQHFARTINLKPPYNVLIDTTFIVSMYQHHMTPLEERIEKLLQNYNYQYASSASSTSQQRQQQQRNSHQSRHFPTKFFILQSAFNELNTLVDTLTNKKHPKLQHFQAALKFIEKHCATIEANDETNEKGTASGGHEEDDGSAANTSALTPAEAIWEYVSSNQQRDQSSKEKATTTSSSAASFIPYIVATQDEELLDKLRYLGTVPIVRLASGSVLLLEQPSKSSKYSAQKSEVKKWKNSTITAKESELISIVKKQQRTKRKQVQQEQHGGAGIDLYQERKRNKKLKRSGSGGAGGISQPNPLSCKKKKGSAGNKPTTTTKESAASKRRKRGSK